MPKGMGGEGPVRKTPKLGELLIDAGVIDDAQLRAALGEQARWGRRLGVTLIKLGMVEENHLIRALAQQLGLPATSLVGRRIAPEVIALVPARVATENHVIPLFVKRTGKMGKLFLGMEDPSKLEVLDDLCFRTGLEIQPVMMGPSEIETAIERYYTNKGATDTRSGSSDSGETTIGERSLGLTDAESGGKAKGTSAEVGSPVVGAESASASPIDREEEISLELSEAVPNELAEAIEEMSREMQKTRLVVKAITQLLVESRVLGLDEIQERIAELKAGDPSA